MSTSFIFAILFLVPGLLMVFIPVFPASIYMLAVALIYGIFSDFAALSGVEFGILAGITILSVLIDQLSGVLGAKWGGASRKAMLWGFIGVFVGSLIGGPLLGFTVLFLAILAAELTEFKSQQAALRAAKGGLIGVVIGYVTNIALAFTFFGLFIYLVAR